EVAVASARDIASALPGGGSDRAAADARANSGAAARRARRRVWFDRLATGVVRAGGAGIIASILAILVFIVAEVLPLLGGAEVTLSGVTALPGGPAQALVADEFGTHVAVLDDRGTVRAVRLSDGAVVSEQALA